jgi:hypothetical protein
VCHFKQSFCLLWPNTIAQRFDICIGRLKGLGEAFANQISVAPAQAGAWCKAAFLFASHISESKKFSIKSNYLIVFVLMATALPDN